MQDPAAVAYQQMNPQFAEQEQLKCPRCESNNTKFCYYNNYNLSQPRHFCKNCRRYWTKGGSLRNIPVGGGTRKNSKRVSSNPKRILSSPSSSSSSSTANPVGKPETLPAVYGLPGAAGGGGGSFSSLLASNGQFGNLFEGLGSHGSTVQLGNFGENANLESESNLIRNHHQHPEMKLQISNGETNENSDGGFLGGEDSSCWGGGNGWPHDLAIYTPGGSNFQ